MTENIGDAIRAVLDSELKKIEYSEALDGHMWLLDGYLSTTDLANKIVQHLGLDLTLVEAIKRWMKAPVESSQYEHGRAQGIASLLALIRGTTFRTEWETGLDGYQLDLNH